MSTSLNPDTLIVMAYARLKGLRDNVPDKGLAPDAMFQDFNRALEDLRKAGHDLSAFQITGNDMVDPGYGSRHVEAAVLSARIDAVLAYFQVDKARIGFETPKP